MTTFDPICESMTLSDQIRLVQVVIKQVDYEGVSGRDTITFNPMFAILRMSASTFGYAADTEEDRAQANATAMRDAGLFDSIPQRN